MPTKRLRLEAEGGVPYMLRGIAHGGLRQVEKAKADLAEAARIDPKLARVKDLYEKQSHDGPPWAGFNIPVRIYRRSRQA